MGTCQSAARLRQGSGPGRVMWRALDREPPSTFPSEKNRAIKLKASLSVPATANVSE